MLVAIGDIGKRVREAREATRPKMTQTQLAKAIGVSSARLSNWERGEHDPASDVLPTIADVLKVTVGWLYGDSDATDPKFSPINNTGKTQGHRQNFVYYNRANQYEDSADPVALPKGPLTRAIPKVGIGPWSAKGMTTVTKTMHAAFAAASEVLLLAEPLPNVRSGMALVFEPADYPLSDTYLLLEGAEDPDQRLIGYVDALDPTVFIGGQTRHPIAAWRVIGVAVAVGWGFGDELTESYFSKRGIGPRTRLPG